MEWETASPSERADMVREHLTGDHPLPVREICERFPITEAGVYAIWCGADWQPEFEAPAKG